MKTKKPKCSKSNPRDLRQITKIKTQLSKIQSVVHKYIDEEKYISKQEAAHYMEEVYFVQESTKSFNNPQIQQVCEKLQIQLVVITEDRDNSVSTHQGYTHNYYPGDLDTTIQGRRRYKGTRKNAKLRVNKKNNTKDKTVLKQNNAKKLNKTKSNGINSNKNNTFINLVSDDETCDIPIKIEATDLVYSNLNTPKNLDSENIIFLHPAHTQNFNNSAIIDAGTNSTLITQDDRSDSPSILHNLPECYLSGNDNIPYEKSSELSYFADLISTTTEINLQTSCGQDDNRPLFEYDQSETLLEFLGFEVQQSPILCEKIKSKIEQTHECNTNIAMMMTADVQKCNNITESNITTLCIDDGRDKLLLPKDASSHTTDLTEIRNENTETPFKVINNSYNFSTISDSNSNFRYEDQTHAKTPVSQQIFPKEIQKTKEFSDSVNTIPNSENILAENNSIVNKQVIKKNTSRMKDCKNKKPVVRKPRGKKDKSLQSQCVNTLTCYDTHNNTTDLIQIRHGNTETPSNIMNNSYKYSATIDNNINSRYRNQANEKTSVSQQIFQKEIHNIKELSDSINTIPNSENITEENNFIVHKKVFKKNTSKKDCKNKKPATRKPRVKKDKTLQSQCFDTQTWCNTPNKTWIGNIKFVRCVQDDEYEQFEYDEDFWRENVSFPGLNDDDFVI